MQELDPKTLFSIFEAGDEQVYRENHVEHLLENPFVLVGMVVRGIDNYRLMDLMYSRNYPKLYKRNKREIKYKYFVNLFNYLKRIKLDENLDKFKVGEDYELLSTKSRLDELLYYFEDLEQYEKCSTIKNIMDRILI